MFGLFDSAFTKKKSEKIGRKMRDKYYKSKKNELSGLIVAKLNIWPDIRFLVKLEKAISGGGISGPTLLNICLHCTQDLLWVINQRKKSYIT